MQEINAETRREALPWDGDSVVEFFLEAHPSFLYREQFAQLFIEAYHAFLAGCPRASIIVAGEALLRAIYDQIIRHVQNGDSIVVGDRRSPRPLTRETSTEKLFRLTDEVNFCQAINALEETKAYPDNVISCMRVIKNLRNAAAHGEMPLLDQWDPDDPRPPEELKKILCTRDFEFPEGYRFLLSKQQKEWFTFDLRKYKCKSLKSLDTDERFAAIQYLLVLEVLEKMRASTEPPSGSRPE